MKKVILGLLICLSFVSCKAPSQAWIDETAREAVLTITYDGGAKDSLVGPLHTVSYEMSNGVSNTVNNPPYANFLLSLDGQSVKYKFGHKKGQNFIRIYRKEVYMDFTLEQQIQRNEK